MQSKIRSQPWWFLPAIAFLVGLLIGWLVIGWGVWPVTYKNSLPPDLRAAERQDYLLMTAESFAASGDLNTATARLSTWPPELLQGDLGELQARLEETDPLRASQIQLLRGAVGASAPALLQTPATETAVQPSAETATPSDLSEFMQTACTTALWVLLVLGGILAVYYLLRRWRLANQQLGAEEPEPLPGAVSTATRPGQSTFPEMDEPYAPSGAEATGTAVAAAAPWDEADEAETSGDEVAEAEQAASDVVATSSAPVTPEGAESGVRRFVRPAATAAVVAGVTQAEPPTSIAGLIRLGEHHSLYQMGESDYDEAFDIHDAAKVYVGQCGVELVDPIGRTHDQAAALQVWLWDTNDPDTKVKVLMSEGAYRDASLRSQLAGEHTVVPIRLGTEFELVSYNLLLKGVVERIDYAEQEPVGGVFAELGLRLAVFQRQR